jgi:intracellular multiplication protein IcmP
MADKNAHDGPMIFALAVFTIALFCIVFWLGMHKQISSGIRWVRVGEMHIISLFTDDYEPLKRQLQSMRPEDIKPEHLLQMTEAVNRFFKIPFVVIFGLMTLISLFIKDKHPFSRKFSLEKIIDAHAEAFPVTAPITNFNPLQANARFLGGPVPEKLPIFAEALTPDEWVSYCNIPINDGIIDEDQARRSFAQQLGNRWKSASDLPIWAQALFVAFSMKANGNRTQSDEFLGRVALCWDIKKGFALTPDLKKEIRQKMQDPKFGRVTEKIAAQHAFTVPALLRCLQIARDQGGVLAPAQFLWLRGVNRHYWYALNNLGRGSVHIEAAGAIAHYRAEKSAGKPIPNPLMESAIEGLKNYLTENYIDKFPAKEFARGK